MRGQKVGASVIYAGSGLQQARWVGHTGTYSGCHYLGQFVTLDTPSDILIPPLEAANGWAWALPLET